MKPLLTTVILSLFFSFTYAQNYNILTENETFEFNDFNISYNLQKIKTKKKQDVYDVRVSIRNVGFDKIILKNKIGESEFNTNQYLLANFIFKNATGTALTMREGNIMGEEIKQNVTYKCPSCAEEDEDKKVEKSSRMVIGYGIMKGATINQEYRIRVPEGEQPVVEVQMVNYY